MNRTLRFLAALILLTAAAACADAPTAPSVRGVGPGAPVHNTVTKDTIPQGNPSPTTTTITCPNGGTPVITGGGGVPVCPEPT